jgi:hypothetical protein
MAAMKISTFWTPHAALSGNGVSGKRGGGSTRRARLARRESRHREGISSGSCPLGQTAQALPFFLPPRPESALPLGIRQAEFQK